MIDAKKIQVIASRLQVSAKMFANDPHGKVSRKALDALEAFMVKNGFKKPLSVVWSKAAPEIHVKVSNSRLNLAEIVEANPDFVVLQAQSGPAYKTLWEKGVLTVTVLVDADFQDQGPGTWLLARG